MDMILRTIPTDDPYAQAQMDQLLEAEGICRDGNLDYSCGLFDEDDALVATGSCFGNTLRCLAVSSSRQGEGLLNQIVSHLMEVQMQRGNSHLFLYTKCKNVRFFSDLGFYEIARVDGTTAFMENRRDGFRHYCEALEKTCTAGPQAASIVMNANPFTLGHRYLVERAAAEHHIVHLFLLSEEAGPIPFAVRRKLVQEGISDLPNVLLHESGPYMISSATFPSYFLKDGDDAIRTQAALDVTVFSKIAAHLGIRHRYVGEEKSSHVTALYNETLVKRLPGMGVECHVIPRLEAEGCAVSASTVRKAIHDGALERIRPLVPDSTYRYFCSSEAEPVRAAIRSVNNVIHY